MWHLRLIRHGWLIPAVLLCAPTPAPAQGLDPVEDLRLALPLQIGEERLPAALDFRRQTLEKRVAALKSLSDMRRALALTEWKDSLGSPPAVQKIDQEARTRIGQRFKDGVEAIVKSGEPDSKLAVITMIGEINASVRALTPEDLSGFGRSLAPLLAELTRDADPEVRSAAARSLGKVNPDPKLAADTFKAILSKDGLAQRRAAAEGLQAMIVIVAELRRRGSTQTGIGVSDPEVVDTATAVASTTVAGLKDADTEVRRLLLAAMLQGATSFSDLVPVPSWTRPFPPPGRPLTPEEAKYIANATDEVKRKFEVVVPLKNAFFDAAIALAGVLQDPDDEVRLLARRGLEMIGYSRARIRRYVMSIPVLEANGEKGPAVHPLLRDDKLAKALEPAVQILAKPTREPNVLVRRASIDFLETLLEGAAPALPSLIAALGDNDRFVRLSAARTLGRVGPVEPERTVPALARLGADPDTDVAVMAAATLERYGPAAASGVPELIRASGPDADPDVRVAIFKALAGIRADSAIAVLITGLSDPEARVRGAAAKALQAFGPAAQAAVPALRQALRDDDPEVRQDASDALLSVLQKAK